jgi:uncharacterized protein (TIGR03437 family)
MPTTLGGTSVSVVDSAGTTSAATLLYTSSSQVNFLMPASVASGTAKVTVTSGDGTKSTASVQIAPVAPGLFTLNNVGLAAANALLVSASGTQTPQNVYTVNGANAVVANPINLGGSTDQAYLILYGTGLQGAATGTVQVTIGGIAGSVLYAGAQGVFPGLDQVNVSIPATLKGMGNVNVQLTAGGIAANPVQVTIQ